MTENLLGLDFTEAGLAPPAGDAARFGGRWRLVGAGLSDVWRYGDLELPATSGRLLMRGPNGTGKTIALEVLWPYVLDLNAAKLGAGKARFTSLKLLMSEGARTKRRYGYVWLTFAAPHAGDLATDGRSAAGPSTPGESGEPELVTYGVRLQFSEGASPAVKPIGFTVPGQPLRTLPLHGEHRTALELEQFTEYVTVAGGHVFTDDDDGYVDDLARRIWGSTAGELRQLAGRLREVRNPSLLGDVSPRGAADALRASLPGVDTDVLTATADALDASNTTREAFARDSQAATVLADFAQVWTGHATDIVRAAHTSAVEAATVSGQYQREQTRLAGQLEQQTKDEIKANGHVQWLDQQIRRATDERGALEKTDAYKASGRLGDLERTGRAERDKANGDFQQLLTATSQAADSTRRHRSNLDRLAEDLSDTCKAGAAQGAEPVAQAALLSVSTRSRSTYTVASRNADPGPGLTVTADVDAVAALAGSWRQLAERARTQADAAALAVTDHRTVATAAAAATEKSKDATRAAEAFDGHEGVLRRSTQAAEAAQAALLEQAAAWAPQHPALRGIAPTDEEADDDGALGGPDEASTWDLSDISALREQESAAVLSVVSEWATLAVRTAERQAAADNQAVTTHAEASTQARLHAEQLDSEAARRRAGELLALPRPQWLPAGDDSLALGSALEWTADAPEPDRDLLEAALADSGLLAASLTADGARTAAWQVRATGRAAPRNLTAVLRCDPDNPHAAQVTAVLSRIALSATSSDGASIHASDEPAALVIGQDGSWRAGVLLADSARAAAQRGEPVPAAAHVGARQRRDAALREAARLEEQAQALRREAEADDRAADTLRKRARAVRAAARTFPSTTALQDAESTRVGDARRAVDLDQARERTAADADAAAQAHATELAGWTARTTARDLPTDLDQLSELVRTGKERHRRLGELAGTLELRHLPRLRDLLDDLDDEAAVASALSRLAGTATASHDAASKTEREVSQLRASAGQSMQDALDQHARLTEELGEAEEDMTPARQELASASARVVETRTRLDTAETNVQHAQPALVATVHRLRRLLDVPAVAEVLLVGVALDSDDDALLEQLDALLAGRRTTLRHLVGQRYDTARAQLARTWTLGRADAGEGLSELDLYVLTHAEHEYTPAAAAIKAEQLARRAQEQLAAAEQSALTDFVIGQLPAAIGTAWVALRDWRHDVNRKMRAAAASSGVGVQVETPLRDDLDDATRTVYRLCCQTSNADRTAEDKIEVGRALQALLAAAEGDTMLERLTKAVDISDWVDVHYLVTRPGKAAGRWNQRTGLSGGERRLVVLAPMLAAIAANYDRLGPTGLRLAALDEVPAEVDERGREGLARYIAELDLDLLCTSYLWDGAPGAWDGIDAHDLEAGPDGTVVAFPMLVRGQLPLPGDAADGH